MSHVAYGFSIAAAVITVAVIISPITLLPHYFAVGSGARGCSTGSPTFLRPSVPNNITYDNTTYNDSIDDKHNVPYTSYDIYSPTIYNGSTGVSQYHVVAGHHTLDSMSNIRTGVSSHSSIKNS